jgi:hypothetical protein
MESKKQKKSKVTDEEPSAIALPAAVVPSELPAIKGRNSSIRQDFSEEDLNNPEVARAMFRSVVGENGELKKRLEDAELFKEKFYIARQRAAVLLTQKKDMRESIGVVNFLYIVGGACIGLLFVPELANYHIPIGAVCIVSLALASWNGWRGKSPDDDILI